MQSPQGSKSKNKSEVANQGMPCPLNEFSEHCTGDMPEKEKFLKMF
jgi:hypothetical protein